MKVFSQNAAEILLTESYGKKPMSSRPGATCEVMPWRVFWYLSILQSFRRLLRFGLHTWHIFSSRRTGGQTNPPEMHGKHTLGTWHGVRYPSVPKLVTEMNKSVPLCSCWNYFHVQRTCCGWLALGRCQAPTELLLYTHCTTGQGQKRRWKSSCVGIRTGRSLTSYCHGENRLTFRKMNLIYCLLIMQ